MFEVTLRSLDQIGNQVVTTLDLHVNLREGVFETIASAASAMRVITNALINCNS